MRAYSMDLRERVLLDSDAGMKAADVAAKYRVSGMGRRPCRWTRGATSSHARGAAGRAWHAGQSGDDLARRAGSEHHR